MNKKQTVLTLTGIGIGAAAVLAYVATRSAGPVQLTPYTELREGPLQEHLVTKEELGVIPATERHHYPVQVAPGLTKLISQGFAPLYCIRDPQTMALPAEEPW